MAVYKGYACPCLASSRCFVSLYLNPAIVFLRVSVYSLLSCQNKCLVPSHGTRFQNPLFLLLHRTQFRLVLFLPLRGAFYPVVCLIQPPIFSAPSQTIFTILLFLSTNSFPCRLPLHYLLLIVLKIFGRVLMFFLTYNV